MMPPKAQFGLLVIGCLILGGPGYALGQEKLTLSEWVRRSLRDAARRTPARDKERKLAVIRAAAEHEFPTADIDEMLDEIERGYGA